MNEIEALDAKINLDVLLDLVENGEEVVIIRNGKPVARLVKESGCVNRDEARQASTRIRALAKSMKLGRFDWQEWKAYRDEGRP